jgi:ATP-binding cassette subfamily C protein CydC
MKGFFRLLAVIAPAWPAMLTALIMALGTTAANVGLMAAAAYLISLAALHPSMAALSPSITGVRFFGLVRAVLRYLERYFAHDATFRALSELRIWFYRALEPLAPARLAEYREGELWSRVVNDVETLKFFYLRVLLPPVVALLAIMVMSVLLLPFGTILIYIEAGGFISAGIILPLGLYRYGKSAGRELPESRAKMTAVLADSIRGMRDLLAFGQSGRQQEQIRIVESEYNRLQGRLANLAGLGDAFGSLIMNLTMASAVMAGILLINDRQLDGIYLAVIALGIESSFEAVLPLAAAYRYWEEGLAAAGRLFAIIDAKPVKPETGSEFGLPASFALEFDNICFRYQERLPLALDRVSFVLPAGGKMAIVGPSGAGKSSLVALLLRFWDYEAGCIRLGDKEIKNYSSIVLREFLGVVPQQTHIFNASLEDNIRIAKPSASPAELALAIEQAALGGLLQGLASMVGENGHALSGGERQRLAIARMLLKKPPLLILDEPMAGLDPVTERDIMRTLRQLMEGRSTILITHRLVGLDTMDEILVLDRGRVVERGRQAELLAKRGLFYKMWSLQNDVFPERL